MAVYQEVTDMPAQQSTRAQSHAYYATSPYCPACGTVLPHPTGLFFWPDSTKVTTAGVLPDTPVQTRCQTSGCEWVGPVVFFLRDTLR